MDEILKLIRQQEAATARGDAAGVLAAMSGDSVTYDFDPPLAKDADPDRGREALERWFATWENGVSVKLRDPRVLVDGDLAVVFGLSLMRGTKKGEAPTEFWSRRPVVLSRTEGDWKIVHDHASVPMHMDGSGKAALDLKP